MDDDQVQTMRDQPRAFIDPRFTDLIFDTVRIATAALYPGARIPETPMPVDAVQQERDKIAAWLDCPKDCRFSTASGECRRFNDFCSRYVADCIRRGEKP